MAADLHTIDPDGREAEIGTFRSFIAQEAWHALRFGNEAIPIWVWPWLLAAGLIFFLVVEAEKLIIRSSASLRRAVTAVEAGAQFRQLTSA